ncbi:MAG: transporter substrate-binding domain-containing protein, partial [Blastocatellia bacterium]|nr:transporter substrate-binding domain-containing protein [Blastocatellia bacterium]
MNRCFSIEQAAGGRISRFLPQTRSSIYNLLLNGIAIIAFTSTVIGCRQHSKKQANAIGAEGEASATKPATEDTVVPEVDLDATEMQMVKQPWFGDIDEMGERRYIRVLVVANETAYFVDRGEQRGYAYELLAEFEKSLRSHAARRHIVPKIAIIPTTRDRLLPALAAGYAEIAIGNLTITPMRAKLVDFSDPILENFKELVVSGPSAPAISSIDELSGKEVYVRASSSYHYSLSLLNKRLRSSGRAPVNIRFTDELFEDEDIIQEVDAGIIPITVIDSHIAKFWSQIYDRVSVHDD